MTIIADLINNSIITSESDLFIISEESGLKRFALCFKDRNMGIMAKLII